jgi:hypothetical protein
LKCCDPTNCQKKQTGITFSFFKSRVRQEPLEELNQTTLHINIYTTLKDNVLDSVKNHLKHLSANTVNTHQLSHLHVVRVSSAGHVRVDLLGRVAIEVDELGLQKLGGRIKVFAALIA